MPTVTPDRATDWPLWWFAQLESALERGDNRAAAEAVHKLERLGIEVRFLVPPWRVNRPLAAEAAERQQGEVSSARR